MWRKKNKIYKKKKTHIIHELCYVKKKKKIYDQDHKTSLFFMISALKLNFIIPI